uniref:zinc finger protein 346-like n=1 Tax=Callithrix jacchus TaxID=9483 RepID=UPI0023DD096C|nr:zinc finger protein 346-like [Callithrix jacchus]
MQPQQSKRPATETLTHEHLHWTVLVVSDLAISRGLGDIKYKPRTLPTRQQSETPSQKNKKQKKNNPVMAQQHYVGKKHRKQETKLKLMARYGRMADPAVTDFPAGKGYPCKTCKIVLNSIEQYQAHVSGFKHKNQLPKTVASSLGQIPMQRQPIQKDSTTLED